MRPVAVDVLLARLPMGTIDGGDADAPDENVWVVGDGPPPEDEARSKGDSGEWIMSMVVDVRFPVFVEEYSVDDRSI